MVDITFDSVIKYRIKYARLVQVTATGCLLRANGITNEHASTVRILYRFPLGLIKDLFNSIVDGEPCA